MAIKNGTPGNDNLDGNPGESDTLNGLAGNDRLNGLDGNDLLDGGDGFDNLSGGTGNDTLVGGADWDWANYNEATGSVIVNLLAGTSSGGGLGNDVLSGIEAVAGGSGNDTLTGDGNSNDLDGGLGNDVLDGGAGGNDRVGYWAATAGVAVNLVTQRATGALGNDTLVGIEGAVGSEFNDTLTGNDFDNNFEAREGNDSINGGAGWDDVSFWNATQSIVANLATGRASGQGNDTLVGIESLHTYTFNDTLIGDANNNGFDGGLGDDFIDGAGGNADNLGFWDATAGVNANLATGVVTGGSGNDTVIGIENLSGSFFNDTLTGDGNGNFIEGGLGDDLIDGGNGGFDNVGYNNSSGAVQVNLLTGVVTGAAGNDTLTSMENIYSGNFSDELTGDNGNNNISGNGGDDSITGNGGNDNLMGDAGDDTILGGAGSDFIRGGAGDDSIDGGVVTDRINYTDGNSLSYSDSAGAIVMDLSGMTDAGGTGTVQDGFGDVDTVSNVNFFTGSNFNDSIKGSSIAILEHFEGGLGNDTIDGGTLTPGNTTNINRVLYMGASAAVNVNLATGIATGGAGTDTLFNFTQIRASAFNDTLTGSNRTDFIENFDARGGNDKIDGAGGIDVARYDGGTTGANVNLTSGTGSDGQGGVDTLTGIENLIGSAFNDTLTGDANNNTLEGRGGNDILNGLGGNDLLRGGLGSDTIDGGVVLDRINYTDGNSLTYSDATTGINLNLSGITGNGSGGTGTVQDGLGGTDTVSNVNFITGGNFNDVMLGSSAQSFEQFEGGLGDDTIDGGALIDSLNQTDGNRVIYQNASGSVTVNLADGTVTGAGGTDTLFNINQVRASAHDDTLLGSDRTDFTESFEGRAGNDSIDGKGGFDILRYDSATVGVSVDLYNGTASDGQDGTDTFANIEGVFGSTRDDTLTGGNAANGTDATDASKSEIFRGGDGNDLIDGGIGYDRADYTNSTAGVNVTLNGLLDGTASDGFGTTDTLRNIEAVRGSDFNDTLTGSDLAFESFEGRAGNDSINGNGGIDRVDYNASTTGVNVNLTAASSTAADGWGGTDTLAGIENVRGSRDFNDVIVGSAVANRLEGQGGNDSINGAGGDDILLAGRGVDTVDGGVGSDTLVVLGAFAEYTANMPGSSGDTVLINGARSENITLRGIEFVQFADGVRTLAEVQGIASGGGDDSIPGTPGNDLLNGLGGNDTLNGDGGNDTLIGGTGTDSLVGGQGNDLYEVDVAGDVVVENPGEGNDTVNVAFTAAATYNLGSEVENATVISAATLAIHLTGNALNNNLAGNGAANILTGNEGNDTLDGGLGNDTLVGGAGDDTYVINVTTDVITETPGSGNDIVNVQLAAAGTFTLGANVENAFVGNGTAGVNLTGNTLNNSLSGNDAANVLNGGAGSDFLRGNGGNDTIDGGVVLDRINYTDGNSLTYSNSAGAINLNLSGITGDGSVGNGTVADGFGGTDNVKNVQFITGSNFNDTITGSGAAIFEQFEGGFGDDTIDGGAQTDSLTGLDSNRANYNNASAAVTVDLVTNTATGGAGNDTLLHINQLRGSNFGDQLFGSNRTDYTESFEGRGGNDTIDGRGGFDLVRYDGATVGVTVDLAAGTASDGLGGTDSLVGIEGVFGSNFNDVLTGGNPASGAVLGDNKSEIFRGNAGDDTIDGGIGYDRVDYTGSTVGVSVTFSGGGEGTAIDGFGTTDTLHNIEAVRGSDFNDTLTGSGADFESFEGMKGNDNIDGNGGTDRVDYSVATTGVNVNLTSGTASDGVGGTDTLADIEWIRGSRNFNDTLVGSAAANQLEGQGGNDSLSGMAGDDTLVAGPGQDTVDGGADNDKLVLAGNFANYSTTRPNSTDVVFLNTVTGDQVTTRNIESVQFSDGTKTMAEILGNTASGFNDTITGDEGPNFIDGLGGDDSITGLGGNDTLQGGGGADTLVGGLGNDSYSVDVAGDVIIEEELEGIDTVNVFFAATGTYTLSDNVEDAFVSSGATIAVNVTGNELGNALTGNAAANILTGNDGNDTLNGGLGNDTLVGGAGDDTYVINVTTDVITETPGNGNDIVNVQLAAAGTFTLGANVENAFVGNGTAGVNLTGNALNNSLSGNDAANILNGGAGSDFLRGNGGNDTIDGGVVLDRSNYTDGNSLTYSNSGAGINLNLSGITGDGSVGSGTVADGFGGTDTVKNVQFITGSNFNDTITGSNAKIFEQFEGGAGNDTIDGGLQTDTLNQFDGNRANYNNASASVTVDLAAGTATGGAGTDTLFHINQTRGSNFGDQLLGSNRTDYSEAFEGRGGDDTIDGRGGIDLVRYDGATIGVSVDLAAGTASDGLGGTDTLTSIEGVFGSNLNDTLTGGNALSGTVFNDGKIEFFRGGAGNDTIDGGQGYDRADYSSSTSGANVTLNDTADGVASDGLGGTDTLRNIEALRGSDFNDSLTGSDTAIFESFEGMRGNDLIDGKGGTDRVDYSVSTAGINVNLGTGVAADGWGGTDSLANIENVRGSRDFNDSIIGSAGNNRLEGQGGNDSLSGLAGDDVLLAGPGQDTVDGGADNDTLVLVGNFADYSTTRPNSTDVVFLNTGTGDRVTARLIENVQFADGTKTITEILGNTASGFNDTITGDEGPNLIDGLGGDDSITGMGGNDTLQGGGGADTLVGGLGDDSYIVDVAADVVIEQPGEGLDNVNVAFAAAGTYVLGSNVENAFISSAATVAVNVTGNASNNQLNGNGAANILIGNEGNDTLDGGLGNDTLIGGAGNDAYVINVSTDVINETVAGSGGNDSVTVLFATAGTFTLGTDIENAFVGNGTAGVNLTGNGLNNNLIGNSAANILNGGAGNDFLSGGDGNDTISGNEGSDFIFGGAGNDRIDGGLVTDRVYYTDGNSLSYNEGGATAGIVMNLSGFTGDGSTGTGTVIDGFGNTDVVSNVNFFTATKFADSILGSSVISFEQFEGGEGNDTIDGGAFIDPLLQRDGNRALYNNASASVVVDLAAGTATGGAGNDTLSNFNAVRGSQFDDTLLGSDRTDYSEQFEGNKGNDYVDGKGGADWIRYSTATAAVNVDLSTGTTSDDGQGGSDTFINIENIQGSSFNDVLTGGNAANGTVYNDGLREIFRGDGGNDTIDGGIGYDLVDYGNATVGAVVTLGDTVAGSAQDGQGGTDVLYNIEGVRGSTLGDVLTGSDSAIFESFEGRGGNDTIDGAGGIDRADYTSTISAVNVNLATGTASDGFGGTDKLSNIENVRGTLNFNDTIVGSAANNRLEGQGGNDSLNGGDGDDTLLPGSGVDTVDGGAGENDTLVLRENFADYTSARPNATDIVFTSTVSSDVVTARNIESVQFADVTMTMAEILGNTPSDFNDIISGDDGPNFIDGQLGNDSISGLEGNDTLQGGGGTDTLVGGAGDDTYVVDLVGDVVVEQPGEGTDQVFVAAAGSYLLAANVENAVVTAAATIAASVTGNALDNNILGNGAANTLTGNDGNDTLDGAVGNDTLIGGAGNDRYIVNVATDVVNEAIAGSDGVDTVAVNFAAAGTFTLSLNVENAEVANGLSGVGLTGNAGTNELKGNAASNVLNGLAGNDTLQGMGGADTIDGGTESDTLVVLGNYASYTITRPNATDTQLAGAGGETILFRNIETVVFADGARGMGEVWGNNPSSFNDVLEGTPGPDSIDGQAGNDSISGLGGNDTLVGGAGIDTLVGGLGDDSYDVDVAADVVTEASGQGVDLVNVRLASGAYTLGDNVENGTVVGAAGAGIVGNALDNVLTGNAAANTLSGDGGNDTLDGGAGNDTLIGGAGDDRYVVNVATDVVNETLVGSDGTDTVDVAFTAAGTFVLSLNVENAVVANGLTGVNLTGNAGANQLTGNTAASLLSGLAGNDTLSGLGGADTLDGGVDTDTAVVLGAFAGYTVSRPNANDTVLTNAGTGETVTLRAIENVQFTDGVKTMAEVWDNIASGFNDVLHGTGGNDSIDGLAGNDSISGLGGNDTLVGGLGIDTLVGSLGDDVYDVDVAGDVVTELSGEGTDLVNVRLASGSYTLGSFVENATVVSAAAVSLVGNGENNLLTGNAVANTLTGNAGNDTLNGGLGNDTLIGGAGNDRYIVNVATDVVNETIVGSDGTDTVELAFTAAGLYTLGANVENGTVIATVAGVNINGNALGNVLTGGAGNNVLSGLAGDDTLVGSGGNDTLDGGAGTADLLVLSGEQSEYTITRPSEAQTVFTRANGAVTTILGIENVKFGAADAVVLGSLVTLIGGPGADTLNGTLDADTLDGGAGNDVLTGLAGDDTLLGGMGNDILIGGADSDYLDGGLGNDTYAIDAGDGVDVIEQNDTVAGSLDVVQLNHTDLTLGAVTFSRGHYSYDDLVIHVLVGEGADQMTENVVVVNYFAGDSINTGGAVNVRIGAAGFVWTEAAIQEAVLVSPADHVFLGGAVSNALSGDGADHATPANDWFSGGGGNDTINGLAGDDTIFGGTGNDNLNGGNDVDLLLGGSGADTLDGGSGNDSLSGGGGADTYLFTSGSGTDVISEGLFTSLDPQVFDSGVGPVYAVGDGDAARNNEIDVLRLVGFSTADVTVARRGDNLVVWNDADLTDQVTVQGFFGNGIPTIDSIVFSNASWNATTIRMRVLQATANGDELTGYATSDRLSGLAGNDTISGREGNDTLSGGLGEDTLSGGSGADRFVFDTAPAAGNVDTILDFNSGVDTIGLSATVFAALGTKGQRVGLGDNLLYDSGTGELSYDADGLDAGAAVVVAILGTDTHPGALGNDFLLI